ncbi:MAG: guanylate kinase [Nitriliruptorales bacterium]
MPPTVERLPDAVLSVSVTTRAARPGEIDGVHYHFVDDAAFDAMIAGDELLEWAHVHRHRSGTPRGWVEERLRAGQAVVLEIDVQGALQVRERDPDAFLVFLAPPSKEELARRLVDRGTEADDERAVRLADADAELAAARRFDAVVVNDRVEDCVERLVDVIDEERTRRQP